MEPCRCVNDVCFPFSCKVGTHRCVQREGKLQTGTDQLRTHTCMLAHTLQDLGWISRNSTAETEMRACFASSPQHLHLRSSAPLLLACPGPDSGFNKEEGGKNNPSFPSASPSSASSSVSFFQLLNHLPLYPPPPSPQIMLLLTERREEGGQGVRQINHEG